MMHDLFHDLYRTSSMEAVFAPEAQVAAMLAFEAALARAQGRTDLIPNAAAERIAAQCRVELFDVPDIFRQAATSGTPVIPLVHRLTELVPGDAAGYVHWGATSQDAMDTALVLQMRAGMQLLLADLLALCEACAGLADTHRRTLMPGRTLLRQAAPIPFGLKAARWLGMITRLVHELRVQQKNGLVIQLGGAVGTLAALGDKGTPVADALARELGLVAPEMPWHAERDRVALLISALGVTAGAMSKMAQDIALLMQSEVSEVLEGTHEDKGASSAMPQKRNAVDAILARASARLAIHAVPVVLTAMEQEHERAAGAWQSEGQAVSAVFCYTEGAAAHVKNAVQGLEIDTAQMRANLERDGGLLMAEALMMALAEHVGKPNAKTMVKRAIERVRAEHISLSQAATEAPEMRHVLTPKDISHALDPSNYLGSSDIFIDRALAQHRAESVEIRQAGHDGCQILHRE